MPSLAPLPRTTLRRKGTTDQYSASEMGLDAVGSTVDLHAKRVSPRFKTWGVSATVSLILLTLYLMKHRDDTEVFDLSGVSQSRVTRSVSFALAIGSPVGKDQVDSLISLLIEARGRVDGPVWKFVNYSSADIEAWHIVADKDVQCSLPFLCSL